MKLFISLLLSCTNIASFCQQNKNTDINKWVKSVINIECRNGLDTKEAQLVLHEYYEKFKSGKITLQKYSLINDSLRQNAPTFTGTAIFLKYKNKRYLITAKHVVLNTHSSLRDSVIFDFIFRIPLENEKFTSDDKWIGDLNKQLFNEGTYIFTSDEIDLAIISIDNKNKEFGDFLENRGHKAIDINDIDTLCNIDYGQDIVCIGFPFYSFEGYQGIPKYLSTAKSKFVANVSTTYGRISTPKYHQHYFIGDINVMPGNSGGAIIKDNKLIGIVSSQPFFYIEDLNNKPINFKYRLPIGVLIKSTEIMPALHQLRLNIGDE